MSNEATSKSGKTWLYVAGMLASLPVLYGLSIGPAIVLVTRGMLNDDVLRVAYGPLEGFVRATDSTELGRSYIRTWLILTSTPAPPWFS